ncbi:inositol polyphosphate multikinase-like [Pogonomyrmex barbatus]|uniref:Kinase n=1 Tax=Pogonomyrmex barbatus TaxID=144034 RepID=A0A6I9W7Z8_9HYME|nr:inositol polyphosphate multikinase-like [Pogonomyrmex barbatus]
MTTVESDEKLPHVVWDSTYTAATEATGFMFPPGLTPLECQIAGHPFDGEKRTIGMLVCRRTGYVLKPATKAILGEREIGFYENLKTSQDPITEQLKKFVPHYYGTTELRIFNNRTKFLMLRDITKDMAEPCVMDIKIGYRTWDPLATPEKRKTEELKYAESKRTYGFCITGYQVYSLSTGRLKKYDRDYGKQLGVLGVVQALEDFLNVRSGEPACRQLVSELLTYLYQIERFFNIQKKYRFYSSSLLVAYDARYLRQHCPMYEGRFNFNAQKRMSLKESCIENFSMISPFTYLSNLEEIRPRLRKSASGPVPMPCEQVLQNNLEAKVDRLCRSSPSKFSLLSTHTIKKRNDESAPTSKECKWVKVKMIDFTHVFPGDDYDLDRNYRDGIVTLIQLLSRIKKTDCSH